MNNKTTKEKKIKITPKTSVTVIILIIIIMGLFVGLASLVDYRNKIIIKDEQIQSMLMKHQQELSNLKQEVDLLRFENEGKVEDIKKKLASEEKLRKAIEEQREAEDLISQQQISSLEKRLSQTDISFDLTSIIKGWQPRVVYIECNFKQKGISKYYQTSGSGVVLKFTDEPIKVLTNRHVLLNNNFYDLTTCNVKLPDSNNNFVIPPTDIEISDSEYDWGTLTINNPDSSLINLTRSLPKICQQKPSLGDSVVVLGYPSIGSIGSVTATDGIVSGFDKDYFITSAKVEQGNSGGAAILLKDSCFLGIPTFASLGQVESLARILDIWTVVTKK